MAYCKDAVNYRQNEGEMSDALGYHIARCLLCGILSQTDEDGLLTEELARQLNLPITTKPSDSRIGLPQRQVAWVGEQQIAIRD